MECCNMRVTDLGLSGTQVYLGIPKSYGFNRLRVIIRVIFLVITSYFGVGSYLLNPRLKL